MFDELSMLNNHDIHLKIINIGSMYKCIGKCIGDEYII